MLIAPLCFFHHNFKVVVKLNFKKSHLHGQNSDLGPKINLKLLAFIFFQQVSPLIGTLFKHHMHLFRLFLFLRFLHSSLCMWVM